MSKHRRCPECGGKLTFGYGLAAGGIGSYNACLDCDFIEKTSEDPGSDEPRPNADPKGES